MKDETAPRKRFLKSFDYLLVKHMPTAELLKETFRVYNVVDFYNGLEQWQRMALANDESAYDEGYKREDLVDLVDHLKLLLNSWYSEHLKNIPEAQRPEQEPLPFIHPPVVFALDNPALKQGPWGKSDGCISNSSQQFSLSVASRGNKKGEAKPKSRENLKCTSMEYIKFFSTHFNKTYLECELLDLLDACVNYDGAHHYDKHNLVCFYQHLLSLVRLSYRVNKSKHKTPKQKTSKS